MQSLGVLGTGMVGKTIGTRLIQLGHKVMIGSRSANNEKSVQWVNENGERASHGTFSDVAKFGDIIFICTKGDATLEAVKLTGPENLSGKTVIDLTNPLDFSKGMPPSLISELSNTNSLGEEVQKLAPSANVVKSLNIVNCEVMINPSKSGGQPTMFLCGNNDKAKQEVKKLLQQFGWDDVLDIGDIAGSRAMEMMLPIWLRIWQSTGNGYNAFKALR